jgi:hypothetical protein
MNKDPKQNYFLKSNDVIGNEVIVFEDEDTAYSVTFKNGKVESVSTADGQDDFDINDINVRFEAGSDLGAAITGENENMSLNELIKQCISEVVVEEYKNRQHKKLSETSKIKKSLLPLIKEVLQEEELLQEYYGGYQIFIFDDNRAFISRYPDAHNELSGVGKPKAVSVPVDIRKIAKDYGYEQLHPLMNPKQPNILEIPLRSARMLAKTHNIKFKRLVDASDIDNFPQGPDKNLDDKSMNKRVAVAGSSELDKLLYADPQKG